MHVVMHVSLMFDGLFDNIPNAGREYQQGNILLVQASEQLITSLPENIKTPVDKDCNWEITFATPSAYQIPYTSDEY